jgi:hypothetical protein
VVVEDVGGAFEVGDSAGDFEDAVVGAGGHVQAFHGVAQKQTLSGQEWPEVIFVDHDEIGIRIVLYETGILSNPQI